MEVFTIFLAQQDQTKKLVTVELSISEDYGEFILEYIIAINSKNDNKYDMLKHKNSKFLFYNFNCYHSRMNTPLQLVRYTAPKIC